MSQPEVSNDLKCEYLIDREAHLMSANDSRTRHESSPRCKTVRHGPNEDVDLASLSVVSDYAQPRYVTAPADSLARCNTL